MEINELTMAMLIKLYDITGKTPRLITTNPKEC